MRASVNEQTASAPGPGGTRTVGLVAHSGRPEAGRGARDAAARLDAAGVAVRACSAEDWTAGVAVQAVPPGSFAEGLDAVVVFGGDGTFLRAAYLARDHGVPLLGVNLGHLGFLSEIEAADVPAALERVVAGTFDVEERMTLAVDIRAASGAVVATSWALNEASLERTIPQRLMRLEVSVGETVFATIPADAMICATPTGSTAYAFSARGPILSPRVNAILLVPVAPHSLFDRTLVVDPGESVSIRPVSAENPCTVSLDGRENLPVPAGGCVTVARGDLPVKLLRLGPANFYGRVREKFGLR
jgi:NAD+ kinase